MDSYFSSVTGILVLELVKIWGPWTWSIKGGHEPSPYFDGPGPWRGSMDLESMFCTFPFLADVAVLEIFDGPGPWTWSRSPYFVLFHSVQM